MRGRGFRKRNGKNSHESRYGYIIDDNEISKFSKRDAYRQIDDLFMIVSDYSALRLFDAAIRSFDEGDIKLKSYATIQREVFQLIMEILSPVYKESFSSEGTIDINKKEASVETIYKHILGDNYSIDDLLEIIRRIEHKGGNEYEYILTVTRDLKYIYYIEIDWRGGNGKVFYSFNEYELDVSYDGLIAFASAIKQIHSYLAGKACCMDKLNIVSLLTALYRGQNKCKILKLFKDIATQLYDRFDDIKHKELVDNKLLLQALSLVVELGLEPLQYGIKVAREYHTPQYLDSEEHEDFVATFYWVLEPDNTEEDNSECGVTIITPADIEQDMLSGSYRNYSDIEFNALFGYTFIRNHYTGITKLIITKYIGYDTALRDYIFAGVELLFNNPNLSFLIAREFLMKLMSVADDRIDTFKKERIFEEVYEILSVGFSY